MNDTNVTRNYKDTMFRMLFREKENLLSLYNALNGTSYTDTDSLEITTLENAVYMNYKNDISFVFNSELMLYEHQSTVNPNMPLRDLFYVTKVLQGITRDENLYSSVRIKIPAPRFVVFYNGTVPQPEKRILRLSDSFEGGASFENVQPELELIVTVYNINAGCNSELMEACRLLKEYAQYVEQVRKHAQEMELPDAVETAVNHCIRHGILADFLSKNRAEAIAVSIFEYDEEKHIKSEKELSYREGHKSGFEDGHKSGFEDGHKSGFEDGHKSGFEDGHKSGFEDGHKSGFEDGHKSGVEDGEERLNQLNKRLLDENRIDDLRRSVVDEEYQNKLYKEYGI